MVDIDVGYLSEAINDKLDRDLNNRHINNQFIIETFVDGTSGYRIWSDGYCEQWGGGTTNAVNSNIITMLKNFSDVTYILTVNQDYQEGGNSVTLQQQKLANNSFSIQAKDVSANIYYARAYTWKACGYLAEGQY